MAHRPSANIDRDVEVHKSPAIKAGSCNGCTRGMDGYVAVIRLRGTELRVCSTCSKELRHRLDAVWR